jgi:hypothetical protein
VKRFVLLLAVAATAITVAAAGAAASSAPVRLGFDKSIGDPVGLVWTGSVSAMSQVG